MDKLVKKLLLLLLLIGLAAAPAGCGPAATAVPASTETSTPTPDPDSWNLVWADEFEQPDGSAPDPEKWIHQHGGSGWGNAELEYYAESRDTSYIENGMLVIKADRAPGTGHDYTSARMNTLYKADWMYGRMEIRAKLPNTQGIWPAFWMLPSKVTYGTWPAGGEIDIMEMIGKEPGRVHGTLHYGNPHTYAGGTFDLPEGETFADDLHVFAVEWSENEFRWYVDDQLYYTRSDWFTSYKDSPYPAPFNQKFYLLINMAIGGYWPGNPDESSVFPQYLYVDYVRMYQHPE
jgi:beta-glucanase (GH16 family)